MTQGLRLFSCSLCVLAGYSAVPAVGLTDEEIWLDRDPPYVSSMPAKCADAVAMHNATLVQVAPIHFDYDSTRIRPDAQHVLDCVVTADVQKSISLEIQGHTDSTGTARYNQTLGERRAAASAFYLEANGVEGGGVGISSAGESRPIAPNNKAKGRRLNRRVEISPYGD